MLTAPLVRFLRSIRIVLSAKKLFSTAKSCGKEADVATVWGKGSDEAVQLGKYSLASISQERGFIDLLPSLLERRRLNDGRLSLYDIEECKCFD